MRAGEPSTLNREKRECKGYYQAHGWPKFVAGLVAGLLVPWMESRLNRNRPSGINHTFFFIPVEMWGLILLWNRGVETGVIPSQ
jgi:hypothetical protein